MSTSVVHGNKIPNPASSLTHPFTHDGELRIIQAGRVTIHIERVNEALFTVTTFELGGRRIDCYSWPIHADGQPIGTSAEQAAWNMAAFVEKTFNEDFETPAQVAARVRAARQLAAAGV